jgi:hypothetical protein
MAAIHPLKCLYGGTQNTSLDASLAIPTRVLRFEAPRRQRPGRSDHPPRWLDRLGDQTAPPGRLDRLG